MHLFYKLQMDASSSVLQLPPRSKVYSPAFDGNSATRLKHSITDAFHIFKLY